MVTLVNTLNCEVCHQKFQGGKPDDSGPVISQ